MRLLLWTATYWPYIGGVQVISEQLLGALRDRGYDACVVTDYGNGDLPDEEEHDGIGVHRFPFYRSLTARDPTLVLETQRRVDALERAFRPDVVHVNFDPSALFHLRTEVSRRAKIVVAFHGEIPAAGRPQTLLRTVLRSAHWVTTISTVQLAELRRVVPETEHISSLIYHGLVPPSHPVGPLPETGQLLCVGRLVAEKGFDVAITAFASLADRFPTTRLVIAGDGPERAKLEQQAKALGIQRRTEFLGWVVPAQVPALMNDASVVVMPSRWQEAFGLVAVQAAQMARPIVATRVGGLREAVRDGESGLLVEPEDPAALARAVTVLLEDRSLALRMGTAARERALAEFGIERYADDYDQLYHHLITEAVHAGSR